MWLNLSRSRESGQFDRTGRFSVNPSRRDLGFNWNPPFSFFLHPQRDPSFYLGDAILICPVTRFRSSLEDICGYRLKGVRLVTQEEKGK